MCAAIVVAFAVMVAGLASLSGLAEPSEDEAALLASLQRPVVLMRKAAGDLSHVWRWGSDTGADLLVVDISHSEGQMAHARAKVSGMRVAVVCDSSDLAQGDPALVRPFKLDTRTS